MTWFGVRPRRSAPAGEVAGVGADEERGEEPVADFTAALSRTASSSTAATASRVSLRACGSVGTAATSEPSTGRCTAVPSASRRAASRSGRESPGTAGRAPVPSGSPPVRPVDGRPVLEAPLSARAGARVPAASSAVPAGGVASAPVPVPAGRVAAASSVPVAVARPVPAAVALSAADGGVGTGRGVPHRYRSRRAGSRSPRPCRSRSPRPCRWWRGPSRRRCCRRGPADPARTPWRHRSAAGRVRQGGQGAAERGAGRGLGREDAGGGGGREAGSVRARRRAWTWPTKRGSTRARPAARPVRRRAERPHSRRRRRCGRRSPATADRPQAAIRGPEDR